MNKTKEKRWELISGVEKGMQDLLQEYAEDEDNLATQELSILIDSLKKMKKQKDAILLQEEELKLRLLISSRERNVYLEKLRKIEEYGEENNWKDDNNYLIKISEILYNDNPINISNNNNNN